MTDWDADRYEARHGFVHEASTDLVDRHDPADRDRVLDVG